MSTKQTAAPAVSSLLSTTQQHLDALQSMQEQAVNAGHRPDMAIRYILRLEDTRARIMRAERQMMRALDRADQEATEAEHQLRTEF